MATIVVATHNAGKLAEMRHIMEECLGERAADIALVSAGELDLPDPVETGTTFEQNALLKARDVAERTGLPAVADDSGLIVDVMGAAPGILSARWSGRHGDDAANNALLLAQIADIPDVARTARFRCAAALVVPGDGDDVEDVDDAEDNVNAIVADGDGEGIGSAAGGSGVGTAANGGSADTDAAATVESDPDTDGTVVLYGTNGESGAAESRRPIAFSVVRSGEMPGVIIREPRGDHGFGYDPIFVPDDQPGRGNADGRPLTSAEMTADEKNAISHRGKALRALMGEIEQLLD